jgi:hypothetical protein
MDNIGMDLGEKGWSGIDWIGLAQNRDRWGSTGKAVINLGVP